MDVPRSSSNSCKIRKYFSAIKRGSPSGIGESSIKESLPMAKIECFFIVPTGVVDISLRRYDGSDSSNGKYQASGYLYHNADVVIGQVPFKPHPELAYSHDECSSLCHPFKDYPYSDARWPKQCSCGYEFRQEDEWQ